MRELAIGRTTGECQKNVNRMKARGWKQISDIKIDDSMFSDIRYVAVMEAEEKKHGNREWGRRTFW